MGLLDQLSPPYDPLDWLKKPFSERSRMACRAWALQALRHAAGGLRGLCIQGRGVRGGVVGLCSFRATPGYLMVAVKTSSMMPRPRPQFGSPARSVLRDRKSVV